VKGYSDNSSTPAYNLSLSEQRANAVAAYLKAKNSPLRQIIVEYFGVENPVASNETEEGRAQNRRVEFDVLKER
jgi:outer membrane protein OmpA-like peptidoglycan-associated protein